MNAIRLYRTIGTELCVISALPYDYGAELCTLRLHSKAYLALNSALPALVLNFVHYDFIARRVISLVLNFVHYDFIGVDIQNGPNIQFYISLYICRTL